MWVRRCAKGMRKKSFDLLNLSTRVLTRSNKLVVSDAGHGRGLGCDQYFLFSFRAPYTVPNLIDYTWSYLENWNSIPHALYIYIQYERKLWAKWLGWCLELCILGLRYFPIIMDLHYSYYRALTFFQCQFQGLFLTYPIEVVYKPRSDKRERL